MCKEYFDYLAKTHESERIKSVLIESQNEEIQGIIQETLNQNCREMYGG